VKSLPCLLFSSFLLLSPAALAQQAPEPKAPEGLQSSQKEVEVEQVTDDDRITDRLRDILATTERFPDVDLRVEHGVALVRGTVADEAERAWVVDLASNTEGVAAVSSQLKLRELPVWNLTPALDELGGLWRQFVESLPRILAGVLILIGVMMSAGRAARWLSKPLERRISSELLRSVANKAVLVAFWLSGIYVFLRVSGLTQIAMTVVGGTGVLGIVLGFAFRDIAENFLASVLISLQRPFRYGDTIEVDGHLGVVQRVTPRGTILMDFDGNYIQIANAQVYKSTIKNYTANPNVRQDFTVGIGYDVDVVHAQEVVMETLREHSAVLADPRPMVLVRELASSTINLQVYFWIDGSKHSQLKVRSALMRLVLSALEREGVSMPDDAREIIFPDDVPVRMLDSTAAAAASEDDAGASDDRPAQRSPELQAEATAAEGSLESETREVNDQARRSRSPEEGEDVLAAN
jgi:small-conductance mechanosensitive channel